jgi:hypothetical protein
VMIGPDGMKPLLADVPDAVPLVLFAGDQPPAVEGNEPNTQAKRWANTVGRPEIQQFVGALNGQRASKGVFLTTSSFSREAIEFADNVNPRVILVDGTEFAELMLDHDVGVTVATRYDIKRIDLDYFGVEDDGSSAAASA